MGRDELGWAGMGRDGPGESGCRDGAGQAESLGCGCSPSALRIGAWDCVLILVLISACTGTPQAYLDATGRRLSLALLPAAGASGASAAAAAASAAGGGAAAASAGLRPYGAQALAMTAGSLARLGYRPPLPWMVCLTEVGIGLGVVLGFEHMPSHF